MEIQMDNFRVAITRILDSWTALELAVQHGAGGPNSLVYARQLPYEMVALFANNAEILVPENLINYLYTVMDSKFNTICEDDSVEEVSQLILLMHENVSLNYENFETLLEKLPMGRQWLLPFVPRQVRVPFSSLRAGSSGVNGPSGDALPHSGGDSGGSGDSQDMEMSETESNAQDAEDNGWRQVTKKRKRNEND